MLSNPLKEAAPITIHRLRNLFADYDACTENLSEDPRETSRIRKAIMAEFIKDFCGIFGKTASVTDEGRGYLRVDVSPRVFDVPLSQWLSRQKIMVPVKGQSVEPNLRFCVMHSGEVSSLMSQVKLVVDENYRASA